MKDKTENTITLVDLDHAPSFLVGEGDPISREDYCKLRDAFIAAQREKFLLEQENQRLKIKDNVSEALNELIKPMSDKAFNFMCFYSGVVGVFLLFRGLGGNEFDLSDSVLRILVGSTAVTVIGLVGMVLTGVFVGARKP